MSDDEIHNTTVRTVLGSSRREHRWDLAHEVDITTALGKSFFDLRRARPMGEDDVEISISCFLGSVELLVPVGTRVTLEGSTFLAGASSDVSGEDDAPPSDDDGVDVIGSTLPRLDISANAVLGRVRVRTPDRPERPRPKRLARFRRKQKPAAAPNRRLADILAESDASEPTPSPAPAAERADIGLAIADIGQPESLGSPAEISAPVVDGSPSNDSGQPTMEPPSAATQAHDLGQAVDLGQPAPPPTHLDSVDAEIDRTQTNGGPVDMEFARRATDEAPAPSLDDFDPADFPDEAPV